jgi:hypothetical protein
MKWLNARFPLIHIGGRMMDISPSWLMALRLSFPWRSSVSYLARNGPSLMVTWLEERISPVEKESRF